MKILVDEKALSKWKERFGDMVEDAINLGQKIFSQYEDDPDAEFMIVLSNERDKYMSYPEAKLFVSYRPLSFTREGTPVIPAIFFKIVE